MTIQQGTTSPAITDPHRARTMLAGSLFALFVLTTSFMLNAMDRQVFPVLLPAVRDHYGFSLEQSGFLSTIFTLGMGLVGLPAGYLVDRYRRKTVILVGIAVFSIFTLLQALAFGFADLAVYRVLSGFGEGVQNAALFSAVGAYFSHRRGLALGTLNFAYGVGAFVSPILGTYLLDSTGHWETPFWLYGLVGFAVLLLVVVAVPSRFTETREEAGAEAGLPGDTRTTEKLLNRNVVACAVAAAVVGFCAYSFLGLYPTYLKTELHFSNANVGLVAGMFAIGSMLGIPAGWLGDRLNPRWFLICALVGNMVLGWLLFNVHSGPTGQALLSVCYGTLASGVLLVNMYALVQRSVSSTAVGRASGLFIASTYLPASVSGYVFAALRETHGWGGAAAIQMSCLPVLGIAALLTLDLKTLRHPALKPRAAVGD